MTDHSSFIEKTKFIILVQSINKLEHTNIKFGGHYIVNQPNTCNQVTVEYGIIPYTEPE